MKLLLIEDELLLSQNLTKQFNRLGFVVDAALDGLEALHCLSEHTYDAVILDLGLPKQPGLVVLETLRKQGVTTPVIILTARNTWQERVNGLKAGADDYLGKPFEFEELLARVHSALRRAQMAHNAVAQNALQQGDLTLDLDAQQVRVGTQEWQALTATEFKLLKLMMQTPQKIFSKSELIERINDQHYDCDSNVVEVYIRRLRQRIGKQRIETYRGQGYQFKVI
ncbi:response regulator transcription factor [Thiomicrorhabdus aquaedulcis]|uniref:response regulator transcription factor n=1 Tax=Thiomicrorhabdus aquaedulcis TaxID=2211106 RepID=UPI000FDC77C8|nr:response regulator transcription factor [Thiomicrorhabdus aquaedulcis]